MSHFKPKQLILINLISVAITASHKNNNDNGFLSPDDRVYKSKQ